MFHGRKVHEITPADIRAFLDHQKHGTSQRNDYKVVSPMFGWARERSMLVANPLNELKRPKAVRTGPAILTIEAFSTLLKAADAKFPDLLPFLVLGGFAGLRTSEMLRERELDQVVQWSDLRDWKMLEIRPEVAKVTGRAQGDRRFVKLDPAVRHWLSPLIQDSGRILDRSQKSFRLRMGVIGGNSRGEDTEQRVTAQFCKLLDRRTSQAGVRRACYKHGKLGISSEATLRREPASFGR